MGFYVKDMYVASARWRPHDPLTNPPTIPETSPVFVTAKYLTRLGTAAGGAAGTPNPDDPGGGGFHTEVPTWTVTIWTTSPVIDPGRLIDESDYLQVRQTLVRATEVIDRAITSLQPDAGQLDEAIQTLQSARG